MSALPQRCQRGAPWPGSERGPPAALATQVQRIVRKNCSYRLARAPGGPSLRDGGGAPHPRGAAAVRAAGLSLSAAAAAAATAAAQPAPLPALLHAAGLFILSCAGALFLLAAVPAMIAVARMALRAESLLRVGGHGQWWGLRVGRRRVRMGAQPHLRSRGCVRAATP
jgi:hypothetical protein